MINYIKVLILVSILKKRLIKFICISNHFSQVTESKTFKKRVNLKIIYIRTINDNKEFIEINLHINA